MKFSCIKKFKLLTMELVILCLGKTRGINQKKIIEDYKKKINFFLKCKIKILTTKKKINSINERKIIESKLITKNIDKSDYVIILDSLGKEFDSIEFSLYIKKLIESGKKKILFIIGGPYGFSDEFLNKNKNKISLSRMTLSYQLTRIFLLEQIYRGLCIINNKSYHHE